MWLYMGFPNNAELKDGDIISVDIGIVKNGYHGDHAYTFAIGDVKPEILKLIPRYQRIVCTRASKKQ